MGPKKNPPRSKTDEQEGTRRADCSKAENNRRRSTRAAAQIATVKISSRNRETAVRSNPEATSSHSGEKANVENARKREQEEAALCLTNKNNKRGKSPTDMSRKIKAEPDSEAATLNSAEKPTAPSRINGNTSKAQPSKSDTEHLVKPNDSESNHNLVEIKAQTDRNIVNGQYPLPGFANPNFNIGPGFVPPSLCSYIPSNARYRLQEYETAVTNIENVISPIDSPVKENSSPIGPLLLPSTDEDIEQGVEFILKLKYEPGLDSAYEENSETSTSCSQAGRTNASTQCNLRVETADASTYITEDQLPGCSFRSDPAVNGYSPENENSDTSEEESRGDQCPETEGSSPSDEGSEREFSPENESSHTSEEESRGNLCRPETEGSSPSDEGSEKECPETEGSSPSDEGSEKEGCAFRSDPAVNGYSPDNESSDISEEESRGNQCRPETEGRSPSVESSDDFITVSEVDSSSTSERSSEGNESVSDEESAASYENEEINMSLNLHVQPSMFSSPARSPYQFCE